MTLPKMLPDRVKVYYRHMTTDELAMRYGKTPQAMRQWLHREGLKDPKTPDYRNNRIKAVKLRARYGWSIRDIAEQLETRPKAIARVFRKRDFVRSVCVKLFRQLAFWPADAFKIDAPPMRIVHSARPKVHGPSGQLELFPVELLQIKAA